jgi:Predicted DNA-binding proteins
MKPRGRPRKYRIVSKTPKISQFSPRGRPGRPDEIDLKMDEFEAIRLSDFEHLRQSEAAKHMRISQQTFSRILKRARKTVAEGLVHGKIIKIQGGSYLIHSQQNLSPKTEKKPQ